MPIAQINGQGIYYEDSGGEGPAVIFMHGFLFDQSMFDAQVKALAPDYRCIRFDARTFGQTQWDGQAYTLYDTVADCIGLMDHLKIDKANIVGMSQGGYAAIRLGIKHPDRVKSLVFMSTYHGVDTEDVKSIYRSMRDTWKNSGPEPLLDQFLFLFIGPEDKYGELRKQWREKWAKIPGDNIVHSMNHLIDRDETSDEQIQQITAPALVIHGEADQGIPIALGELLHKNLPNADEMVRVPEGTHGGNLTHPQLVNQALRDFLAKYN